MVALLVYVTVALVLFGRPLLDGGTHECLCVGSTTDAGVYVWAFAWWPHALLHGLNPFYTHLLYAPHGVNLAHGSLVPGAALMFAPVTAIAGPLFAFNLAMLLSPVLAAFFAFLLCRRITHAFWPSLVGGWLFGFSTYMLGQLVGHLNLTLVFFVPAVVHLVLRALSAELSRRRFVVLMVIALVLQFSFSVEVFASLTLFGAVALALTYVLASAPGRARLRRLLGPIALSYLVAVVIVSPYLYYALQPGGEPLLTSRSDKFSNDLLAFVVPTYITAFGGLAFLSTSVRFTAGAVEGGAYLGVPVILMMLLGARLGWRRLGVRVMLGTLLVVLVCTLGGRLNVAGPTRFPLPWALVHRLPVLGLMLPARFILYGILIGSVLAAMWLAAAGRRFGPWLLAALSVVSLWPAVGRNYWHGTPEIPTLFTTSAYRQAIGPRDTALVLPIGIAGQSMLWQATTNLGFTMASGYVTGPEAPDPYKHYAIYPMLTYLASVPHEVGAAATFLAAQHITVVVLDPRAAATSPWVPTLEQLGWGPTTRDGVVLLRHNGFVPEPTQPSPPPRVPHANGPPAAQRAARLVTGEYLRALVTGDATPACALLTPQATAAVTQVHSASTAGCARSLAPVLHRGTALRKSIRRTAVGVATITGTFGYVEIIQAGGARIEYLPVRETNGQWQVNGAPVLGSPTAS